MRRRVRGAVVHIVAGERSEGRAGAEDALERIDQQLREAAVKFGLGELSPGTYAILRRRLEAERAEVEASLLDGSGLQ